MPDAGPFGETFFDASVRAMVVALLLNKPGGGRVESVLTLEIHLALLFFCILSSAFLARCVDWMLGGTHSVVRNNRQNTRESALIRPASRFDAQGNFQEWRIFVLSTNFEPRGWHRIHAPCNRRTSRPA